MKSPRWLIFLGSLILFFGAMLHLLGYSRVVPVLVGAGVDPTIVGAFKAIWLAFSVQFLVLAPAFVWISRRPETRSLLLFLALVPVLDSILMYYFVGPFIGDYIVSAGAALVVIGAWLTPRNEIP